MNKALKYLMLPLDNFPRLCLTAFLFNFASYFYWLVVPLMCVDQGGSTLDLSLLQTVAFVIYSILSPFCGKLGDVFNSFIIIRVAMCFFVAAVAVILIFPRTFFVLYISVALWPFCTSCYWPITTGTCGLEAELGCENRNASLYQVSWSIGKSLGFLLGGILKGALGTNALYICIAIVAVNMVIYPYRHPKKLRERLAKEKAEKTKTKKDVKVEVTLEKNTTPSIKEDHPLNIAASSPFAPTHQSETTDVEIPTEVLHQLNGEQPPETPIEVPTTKTVDDSNLSDLQKLKLKWNSLDLKNKTYIYIGYILQLGIYGTSAILTNSYVKLAQDKDITIPIGSNPLEMYIGITFFFYFIAQTIVMICMSFTTIWIYMRSLIFLVQLFYLAFLFCLSMSSQPYVNWVLAFFGGLAGGFAYQTSTYYSMRASESSKSMFVGISECIGGLGNALLPLFSGLLCTFMSDNYIQIYISIIFVLFCCIAEEIVYHSAHFINEKRQEKRIDPKDVVAHHSPEVQIELADNAKEDK
ncbi:hypothetical protein EIN_404550 [Entamoeba invadens IP1]|uniref:Major facilitator superfamily (MFS) profile domain-containing protein n=1 Tax=Entamoeba invadens IP1 TaxID=370355 RepID=A0A0A1UA72_ENTIV|nr:hypothetical protein EIN_404550 [Entamoeba invadens IP1]ELP90061.1 hypothetical protein EIN_404550 [Entamoeba invadens IP1]|eukprot:XP_004256832.1 hypothetical protein EIN_404550 [Entamoeba invadens IP1]